MFSEPYFDRLCKVGFFCKALPSKASKLASCDFIYNRVETVCKSKDSDMRSRCLPSSPLTIWEGAGFAHANSNCKRRISTLQKLDQITEKTLFYVYIIRVYFTFKAFFTKLRNVLIHSGKG